MALCCFCLDCDCTFKGRCKLREHLRSHTQEKVVACPTCGGMFANNTKFFDHIRRQTALDRKLLWVGTEIKGSSWALCSSIGICFLSSLVLCWRCVSV